MAWETTLDRLLLQQVHDAEKGALRASEVRQLVVDLLELRPDRPQSAFLCGYARVLLGLDLPVPAPSPSARRWETFGRLRAHDRRGERSWVADLLKDSAVLVDLLREPRLAAQALPLVLRTMFWTGNLSQAVHAIEFLAGPDESSEAHVLVDAGLTDLLTRLERREPREGEEPTATILERCMGLRAFAGLPGDVRARYHLALAQCATQVRAGSEALAQVRLALECPHDQPWLQSRICLVGALAELGLHDVSELEPRAERPARARAFAWLDQGPKDPEKSVPEVHFARGILLYETGGFPAAQAAFDAAVDAIRRNQGEPGLLLERARFFLAAAILAGGDRSEAVRAVHLLDQALSHVRPDLESFFPVHEELKRLDRRVALKFLDAVDVGRGTAPDQLLLLAFEYLDLGEAEPASRAAERVLQISVDLDQRVEAMKVLLTARNMRGQRQLAQDMYQEIRDLLLQRGAFTDLEKVLHDEKLVGQALDHLEIKTELVDLYEQMEGKEFEKAGLQTQVARALRARKDVEALQEAFGILQEVGITHPDLVREDLAALEKLLQLEEAGTTLPQSQGQALVEAARKALGHKPRVLVVGGNERQRRHHPRFEQLAAEWGFAGEWLMANYVSPQKVVSAVADRVAQTDLLIMLHWNRHEATEPALDLARKAGVLGRTVHYAGFTSLQVALGDSLQKLGSRGSAEGKGEKAAARR